MICPMCPLLGMCVINVCSNGGATYIVNEIIAKDNLNIANLTISPLNKITDMLPELLVP